MDFERASRRYCIEPRNDSLASPTCGWTRATGERTRARTGSKRRWALERGSHRASEKASSRRGVDGVGQGMGQRGRERRLAETDAAQRVCGFTKKVGSGADDRLDRPEEDEQRLREIVCEWRGVGVRCHDPPHDEAPRPCLRTFHTASEEEFSEVRQERFVSSASGGCAPLLWRVCCLCH
jgi:hypothetical protein